MENMENRILSFNPDTRVVTGERFIAFTLDGNVVAQRQANLEQRRALAAQRQAEAEQELAAIAREEAELTESLEIIARAEADFLAQQPPSEVQAATKVPALNADQHAEE